MYFILPETEGRSLLDIELHYSDDSKRLTDIHIKQSTTLNEKSSEKWSNIHKWMKNMQILMFVISLFDVILY